MSESRGYLAKTCREISMDRHGGFPRPVPRDTDSCCLRLPPGLVLLRRLEAPEQGRKDLLDSLRLHAEETLPDDPGAYFQESWIVRPGTALLAALPGEPLRQARDGLGQEQPARQLIVPEFLTPQERACGLVLWSSPGGIGVCCWDDAALQDYHGFPAALAPDSLLDLLQAALPREPRWIALDPALASAAGPEPGLDEALARRWPAARHLTAPHEAADSDGWRYAGPGFKSFLREEELSPAAPADKWRLGLLLTGAVCAALFLLFAEVRYLEGQLESEQHQASLLKVQANRSGQLATRIGAQLQELDELRAMTVGRKGVPALLRDLSDALPPGIRLEAVSLERGGGLTLEGLAPSEHDITHFMGRLAAGPNLQPPTLTFAQKATHAGGDNQAIRFRLELNAAQPLLQLPENPDGT